MAYMKPTCHCISSGQSCGTSSIFCMLLSDAVTCMPTQWACIHHVAACRLVRAYRYMRLACMIVHVVNQLAGNDQSAEPLLWSGCKLLTCGS